MQTLAQWLKRTPAGPKPKRPMPRMSKRRRKTSGLYLTARAQFLAKHPWCAVSPALFGKRSPATEVHHRKGRVGANYLDESTWLPVAPDAHRWIHNHPAEARARGWLA